AFIFLSYRHGVAVWTAGVIKPCPGIEAGRLRNKRIVIHPAPHGIAPPAWLLNVLRQLPAIGPDGAPLLIELVEDDNVFGCLNDPACSEIMKNDSWKTLWVAPGHRIICERGWHRRDSESRFVGHVCRPAFGCER